MPNDSEIQTEAWADPGEPSEEQAFEKDILEKKIFKIEPRSGSLDPGEQRDLSISYFPRDVCKHHLNTFFQIQNGKPLIVRMEGETLDRRACLQLLKHTYEMPAVPIGMVPVRWDPCGMHYPDRLWSLDISPRTNHTWGQSQRSK